MLEQHRGADIANNYTLCIRQHPLRLHKPLLRTGTHHRRVFPFVFSQGIKFAFIAAKILRGQSAMSILGCT